MSTFKFEYSHYIRFGSVHYSEMAERGSSDPTEALAAIQAWLEQCPPQFQPQVAELHKQAQALAQRLLVAGIAARAAKHGHTAVTTAWTDAACEKRFCTMPAAIGDFSCDTHLLSTPSGAFIEHQPTMQSLKVSAQIALAEVALYDGQSLQDHLLANGAKRIPRKATVKVKSLLIYHPMAQVTLKTRAYAGVQTTTYAYRPGGTWDDVGVRCGDGLLGLAGHGQMKAFHFEAADAQDTDWCQAKQPLPFGPAGAGIDCGRDDIIMTVTLFRKPLAIPKLVHSAGVPDYSPTMRSLCAAKVTAGQDLGFAVAAPDQLAALGDVDGVCIEIFRCLVVDKPDDSNKDVDDLCHANLRMQADIGGNALESAEKTAAKQTLERLENKAYCTHGHGPWEYASKCPGCGTLCVCH